MFYKKQGRFSKVSGGKVMYLKQPNRYANDNDIRLIPLEDGADQPLF